MKILAICNSASGLYDFRGMLLEKLKAMNNEIVAIVPFTDQQTELKAEEELEEIQVRCIRIPMERRGMNPVKDCKLLLRYKKAIQSEKPDYVITYTIKPNIYGGIVCRLCNVPFASNITGLGTALQNDGILSKIVMEMYKISLSGAKTVFFENVENRQFFLNKKLIREEQAYLLNGAGVNLEKFSYQDYPKECDTTKFLFIGRVMKEKGIEELFAATRRLIQENRQCSLSILGGYDEDYEKTVKKFEQEGWLHYYGYQSDVRPFIADCHCFVLPSWHEGMANTNLETAASGRPVITSNIHGCLEAVEDGVSGILCERKNADDLYRAMKEFLELPYEQKKQMGLAGRRRMEKLFDKRMVVDRTIERLMTEEIPC